eukprot:3330308-Prymnesium_polylepis.2
MACLSYDASSWSESWRAERAVGVQCGWTMTTWRAHCRLIPDAWRCDDMSSTRGSCGRPNACSAAIDSGSELPSVRCAMPAVARRPPRYETCAAHWAKTRTRSSAPDSSSARSNPTSTRTRDDVPGSSDSTTGGCACSSAATDKGPASGPAERWAAKGAAGAASAGSSPLPESCTAPATTAAVSESWRESWRTTPTAAATVGLRGTPSTTTGCCTCERKTS